MGMRDLLGKLGVAGAVAAVERYVSNTVDEWWQEQKQKRQVAPVEGTGSKRSNLMTELKTRLNASKKAKTPVPVDPLVEEAKAIYGSDDEDETMDDKTTV